MKISKREKQKRRHKRIRAKIVGTSQRPRLCVFRSNKYIYAQLINDEKGQVLLAMNDRIISSQKNKFQGKITKAFEVGKLIAEKALKKNIKKVVFDRRGYKYHGRIKALAEGARNQGLEF